MGRIKSTLVKRTSHKLLEEKAMFTTSFEHNKKVLGRTMPSKKIRNKIAGYLARLVVMQEVKDKEELERKNRPAPVKVAQVEELEQYEQ
jgi:ribosomal protein S17E